MGSVFCSCRMRNEEQRRRRRLTGIHVLATRPKGSTLRSCEGQGRANCTSKDTNALCCGAVAFCTSSNVLQLCAKHLFHKQLGNRTIGLIFYHNGKGLVSYLEYKIGKCSLQIALLCPKQHFPDSLLKYCTAMTSASEILRLCAFHLA